VKYIAPDKLLDVNIADMEALAMVGYDQIIKKNYANILSSSDRIRGEVAYRIYLGLAFSGEEVGMIVTKQSDFNSKLEWKNFKLLNNADPNKSSSFEVSEKDLAATGKKVQKTRKRLGNKAKGTIGQKRRKKMTEVVDVFESHPSYIEVLYRIFNKKRLIKK
jgi:hypothetical protein